MGIFSNGPRNKIPLPEFPRDESRRSRPINTKSRFTASNPSRRTLLTRLGDDLRRARAGDVARQNTGTNYQEGRIGGGETQLAGIASGDIGFDVLKRMTNGERRRSDENETTKPAKPNIPKQCMELDKQISELRAQRTKLLAQLHAVNVNLLRSGSLPRPLADLGLIKLGRILKSRVEKINRRIHDLGIKKSRCLKENK